MSALSGYRLMWMLVMFDLPVLTPKERKQATRFRNDLLDLGFERAQLSVYMRFCGSRERSRSMLNKVRAVIPPGGEVSIFFFTDKQYSEIVSFRAARKLESRQKMTQLTLF